MSGHISGKSVIITIILTISALIFIISAFYLGVDIVSKELSIEFIVNAMFKHVIVFELFFSAYILILLINNIESINLFKIRKITDFFIKIGFILIFILAITISLPVFFVGAWGLVVETYFSTRTIFVIIADRSGVFGRAFVVVSIIASSVSFSFYLYNLKRKNRIIYGKIEVLFGILAIIVSVFGSTFNFIKTFGQSGQIDTDVQIAFLQFLAGAYIIVRGLGNVEDGLGKSGSGIGMVELFKLIWTDLLDFFDSIRYIIRKFIR